MKTIKEAVALLVLLFTGLIGFAQKNDTEIIYWNDTSSWHSNFSIISMLEGPDKEIYMLSKATDEENKNLHPNFTRMSFDGGIANTNTIENLEVDDLNSLVVLPDGKLKIAGTTSSGGYMQPYIETLNSKGEIDPYIYQINLAPIYSGINFKADEGCYFETMATLNPEGEAQNADPYQPGSLWNVWIYKKDYRKVAIEQEVWHRKLVSKFQEEPITTIQSINKNIICLTKRYTTTDFSTYIPVLSCLDPNGKLSWTKEFSTEENFNSASLVSDRDGNIYSIFNFGDEQMILNHTAVYLYTAKGDSLKLTWIDKFCANGGVLNKDNNILLYGGTYKTEMGYAIKKATTCLINDQLKVLNQNSMNMFDKPDSEIPGMGFSVYPTSSDFLTGISLSDGRYALGGRVYMPARIDLPAVKIATLPRYNRNLVVFTNSSGDFGKFKE